MSLKCFVALLEIMVSQKVHLDNSYTAPCGVLDSENRVLSSYLFSNVTPPSPSIDITDDKH
ncbi:LOW QUALITY PROTEIN: hypothetical protein TorRG33x02_242380 [Trema orientale]|uniref:Uncharacterized protein n=1 Tax=Trema orientale TaxID=63057 RepID=A0A2P5DTB9_TREOI|nr:LOW QUALITY PROTEIN: hypothetical protein TorRG33x02_242380 [Trema orientale]